MTSAPAIHHVFVDFENVQEIDFEVLGNEAVRFTLLVGFSQRKLDVELVEQLLRRKAATELVRVRATGPNALDMALVYELGRVAAKAPESHFYIISRDSDFDPLIEHLLAIGIRASRHSDYRALKAVLRGDSTPEANPEEVHFAVSCLRANPHSRPKKKKALINFIQSALGKHFSKLEIESLISSLQDKGYLEIGRDGAITYHFSSNGHVDSLPWEDSDETDDNIEIPDDDIPF